MLQPAILQELIYDSLREGAVWPFDDHYIRPPHFHGQLECLIVTHGTARLHLGARTEHARAGQLCWILPGVPHVMSDFSADFDMWVVQLDPALVGQSWRGIGAGARATVAGTVTDAPILLFDDWPIALGERLAGRAAIEVGDTEAQRLGEMAERIWSTGSAAEARTRLRALCDLALRVTLANLAGRFEPSVSQLASCLLLAAPAMNRSSLAAELGVSEGHLSRSIRRELGVSFLEQRARTRVAHFLALAQDARHGRHNLLDAALDAGFGSYSQFHRTFTRVAGSAPRDYLRSGRHRLQLMVAGDVDQPQSSPMRSLPEQQRQRALLHA